MSFDITHILEAWTYQPGQVIVRKFRGRDGGEKIQLRVDLGVLQMNAEGRPDGKKPFGHPTLLEHFLAQLERHRAAHEGRDDGFVLSAEDCAKIQQEAIQYHHRYICKFQLEDHEGVIRDTQRNLDAFDFVSDYAISDDVSWSLQQFRPQLLMMHTRARGAMALETRNYEAAIRAIGEGVDTIRQFLIEYDRQDVLEQCTEIQSLERWLNDLQSRRPLSEVERLEQALNEAVRREDYEKAAEVRDALRNLRASPDA
jgi:hypothetical protein